VAGVLGILPGIIGLLQANETVKLVLRTGETLAGRMLLFDAMSTSFDEIRLWRDPACPACGDAVVASLTQAAAPAVAAAS
jgi:molybdopterin/thiamine biosynthesis adenylyltransferase